jgi:hypothetical protein
LHGVEIDFTLLTIVNTKKLRGSLGIPVVSQKFLKSQLRGSLGISGVWESLTTVFPKGPGQINTDKQTDI